ncbi:SusC/RagA family TonB-linked outer membrane protein [Flaviaesturariibacter amylovorans]|uniref:SusC/RagA family TonB-linked outer membrane protein n=2 Tax=Flaviaesturariibacter amylovorans TaxID=1084520 RepID=A0ABP8GAD8_9BACT
MHVQAQNRTVAGKVTDQAGQGVPNATVGIKGTNLGTTTGADGSFSISVPANARTLVISSVGYGAQEIRIGSESSYTVSLRSAETGLQEVVVVGYQARRKRDEAGAISTIRAAEIENLPVSSIDRAMQGRAAGVVVQGNSGIPGGGVTVRVRGVGSIGSGNNPLYVVDGVQLNTNNTNTFTQSNPLAFINPNDIESIDILKDAASAAIYGAAASNGVVIITTKKGKAGKTRFTLNSYYGQTSPLKYLDVVNSQEYFQLRTEATANSQNLPTNSLTAKRSVLINDYRQNATLVNGLTEKGIDSLVATIPTYDWQREAFRNGAVRNVELGVSGGNERTTFRLSANYNVQEAIVTKADFRRAGLNFNLSNKATDRLTISTGINLSTFDQKGPFGGGGGSSLGNIAFSSPGVLPFNPIYNSDGSYYGMPGQTPSNLSGVLSQNAVAVNDLNKISQRTNQLIGNIQGEYKLFDWLSFRSYYALDYRNVTGDSWWDPRTPDAFARGGLGQTTANNNINFLTTQLLSAQHNFNDDFRVDGVLGYEYRRENFNYLYASADNFPGPQFTTLGTAANPVSIDQSTSQYRQQSVFGNANITYAGKYILGLVARYDGASRFGSEKPYGFFPGIKLGWNIDREKFFAPLNFISTFRLRASLGSSGNNQIGNFDALGLYSGRSISYGGRGGIQYANLANPRLTWESNRTLNLGLDYGFLNNRISGSVEVYNKRTTDLLLSQGVSLTTGFTSVVSNVGEVENKGVEVTLTANPLKSKRPGGFNWSSTFTMAYNKSKLLQLYGDVKNITVGSNPVSGNATHIVGEELYSVWTAPYAGVNPATGRPMWYDSLGNITYQIQTPRDNRVIGSELPKYTGGLNNTFSFKGFTLDVFFQYEFGRLVNDGQVSFLSESSGRISFLQSIYEERWTKPGDVTDVPRMNLTAEPKASGGLGGSRLWVKGDYIRLKNVMLSYDIPNSIMRRIRSTGAKVYVQGTNLATWTASPSYDPEFLGAGTGQIPQSRNVTVGIQLGF